MNISAYLSHYLVTSLLLLEALSIESLPQHQPLLFAIGRAKKYRIQVAQGISHRSCHLWTHDLRFTESHHRLLARRDLLSGLPFDMLPTVHFNRVSETSLTCTTISAFSNLSHESLALAIGHFCQDLTLRCSCPVHHGCHEDIDTTV